MKIFLVEDNADSLLMLTYLLQQAGHQVHGGSSKRAALRDFAASGSELLISDIGLPDGTGCELLRELRAGGLFPYALAMSGFGSERDVAASLAAGFRHHIVKPVDSIVLERLIQEAAREIDAAS